MREQVVSSFLLLAGTAGVLVPVTLLLGVLLALQAAPWFSWTVNALSDLGIPPGSGLFFNGAMVCAGVLLLLFSLGVRIRVSRTAGMMLSLAAVMLVGVGLVSERAFWVHWVISGSFFFLLVGTFLFFWFHTSVHDKMFMKSSRGLCGIAVVSTGWFWFFPGAAVPEVCVLVPAFFWCAWVGVVILIMPALAQKKTLRQSTPAISG